MGRILQNSMLKCIDSENKDGVTFLEVLLVGIIVPSIIKKVEGFFKIQKNNQ
jgi:hypothetical protein